MTDVGQVLASGGTAIVGVAVGAGLTYFFGALNRRHQEAREEKTRWYEKRLQAYSEVSSAVFGARFYSIRVEQSDEEYMRIADGLNRAFALVRLVGSPQAVKAMGPLAEVTAKQLARGAEFDDEPVFLALDAFEAIARRNLGQE